MQEGWGGRQVSFMMLGVEKSKLFMSPILPNSRWNYCPHDLPMSNGTPHLPLLELFSISRGQNVTITLELFGRYLVLRKQVLLSGPTAQEVTLHRLGHGTKERLN
jgi:hypothetical protein